MFTKSYRNLFLQQLGRDALSRLNLRAQEFNAGAALVPAGQPIQSLFFIEEGFSSTTIGTSVQQSVEVAVTGYESVIGLQALWGLQPVNTRIFMQSDGHGHVCSLDDAVREATRGDMFQNLAMRHISIQLGEALANSACNAMHNHEQRVARWLLICADKSGRRTFSMSQQFIAHMIGSTRPTVSDIASSMKHRGIIDYSRGTLSILDIERLRTEACECYQPMRGYSPVDVYVQLRDIV